MASDSGFWRLLGWAFVGWLGLGAVMAIDALVFHALDSNYLRWYIENGSAIALVTAFLSLVVDLDLIGDLVSAHPIAYLRGAFRVLAVWFTALGAAFRPSPGARYGPPEVVLPGLFDALASALLALGLSVLLFAWLLVVVPVQYFVFLVCGAPARTFSTGGQTLWLTPGGELVVGNKSATPPAGWLEQSVANKPVRLTNAFAAAALFGLSFAV
jgi:hypothetical protein